MQRGSTFSDSTSTSKMHMQKSTLLLHQCFRQNTFFVSMCIFKSCTISKETWFQYLGFSFITLLIFLRTLWIYQNAPICYLDSRYTRKTPTKIIFYSVHYLSSEWYFLKNYHFYNVLYFSNERIKIKIRRACENKI
jgi:hypothetical protein